MAKVLLSLYFSIFFVITIYSQNNLILFQYENQGQIEKIIYPNNSTITYTYDAIGNRLTQTISTSSSSPQANFSANPTSGLMPLSVTFTDASVQGANPITSWQWDFNNDGTIDAAGQGPHNYTFSLEGVYSVKLIVSDGVLVSEHLALNYITVGAYVNQPPAVENQILDQQLSVGGNYTRDLEAQPIVFTDLDGDTLTYSVTSSNDSVATAIILNNNFFNIKELPIEKHNKTFIESAEDRLYSKENPYLEGGTTGSQLVVNAIKEGSSIINVTADDGNGGSVSTSFTVIVGPGAASPQFVWGTSAGGTGNDDSRKIIVDHEGNIVIAGTFDTQIIFNDTTTLNSNSVLDIFVAKYNQYGNLIWVVKAGGSSEERLYGLACDNSNNIFICGTFRAPATFGSITLNGLGWTDSYISKLNSEGDFIWANQIGGEYDDTAFDLSIDNDNNILTTGYFQSSTFHTGSITLNRSGNSNSFVCKCNNDGTFLWAKQTTGSNDQYAKSVTTDSEKNVIVAGEFLGDINLGGVSFTSDINFTDLFIVKYDLNGNLLWGKQISGSSEIRATTIKTDFANNYLLTGYYFGNVDFSGNALISSGSEDIYLAKMNSSGDLLWANSEGGESNDWSYGLDIDSSNNYYITGSYWGPSNFGTTTLEQIGNFDIFVTKYGSSGNINWAINAGGQNSDYSKDIAVINENSIYLTGSFLDGITFGDSSLISRGQEDIFLSKVGNGNPNRPPYVVNLIDDEILNTGSGYERVLIYEPIVFEDLDDDRLFFSSISSDTSIVNTTTFDSVLFISAISEGVATISIYANDGRGGSTSTSFQVTVIPPTIVELDLKCKVFLEGCFQSGKMDSNLVNQHIISLSQPYNTPPFNYPGNESVDSIPSNIVDWILVGLRTGIDTGSVILKKVGFLKTDGTITGLDGINSLKFTENYSYNYYLVIYHRNHLSIMSSNPIFLTTNTELYDFTDSQTKAYTTGPNPMKDLGGGKFGMIAGDADADGVVDYEEDLLIKWIPNFGLDGYYPADFNMNGTVDYEDDVLQMWLSNFGYSSQVPGVLNAKKLQLKININKK